MKSKDELELWARVRSDNRRTQLEAIRDYLVHELEGNRCNTCRMSQLRTGDTAAIVLRLTKVLEEIDELPVEGEVDPVDELSARRHRTSAPKDSMDPPHRNFERGTGSNRPG